MPAVQPIGSSQFYYTEDTPSYHGLLEWNGQPAYTASTAAGPASGTPVACRFVAQTGGSVVDIISVLAAAGTGMTAATTATISNVVNNGSGNCRVTATAHGFSTNDVLTQAGIVGATEANTADVITVIDANTYDLNNTAFTLGYTSGGTATRSANTWALYDSGGNFLSAAGDQVSNWGGTNVKTAILAKSVTLVVGTVYYAFVLFNGASMTWRAFNNGNIANAQLSGATLRWGLGTASSTKLPNVFTPSGLSISTVCPWIGLK